jgi:hypothetical protein
VNYHNWYGLNGIYIDQMANWVGLEWYYSTLTPMEGRSACGSPLAIPGRCPPKLYRDGRLSGDIREPRRAEPLLPGRLAHRLWQEQFRRNSILCELAGQLVSAEQLELPPVHLPYGLEHAESVPRAFELFGRTRSDAFVFFVGLDVCDSDGTIADGGWELHQRIVDGTLLERRQPGHRLHSHELFRHRRYDLFRSRPPIMETTSSTTGTMEAQVVQDGLRRHRRRHWPLTTGRFSPRRSQCNPLT